MHIFRHTFISILFALGQTKLSLKSDQLEVSGRVYTIANHKRYDREGPHPKRKNALLYQNQSCIIDPGIKNKETMHNVTFVCFVLFEA